VDQLVGMGFPRPASEAALAQAHNDVAHAAALLTEQALVAQPVPGHGTAAVGGGGAAVPEAVTPVGAGSAGTRMHADAETALSSIPSIDWTKCDPKRSCFDEMLRNPRIRAKVPRIEPMVEDIRFKVLELQYTPPPVPLDENCTAAIVAYARARPRVDSFTGRNQYA
jgi:hypothetical protein